MKQADEVRALFTGNYFGAPCSTEELSRAESELGEQLNPELRELYLSFNGFHGPTDAGFFWPLWGDNGFVQLNKFYREDDLFPRELMLLCMFFGDGGGGSHWGYKRDLPGKIILWDAEWGADFEVVGNSPLEVWRNEKVLYDSLE